MIKTVVEKFEQLKMKTCVQNLEEVMKMAEEKNWPPLNIMDHLLDLELDARRIRRIALRFKESKLIEKPTINQFDFNFHVSRKKQKTLILNLMSLEFIKQKKDIILIGNPGVGKSFLAKCIAYAATQAGIKTLFTTAMDMINHLISAEADHSLLKKLQFYQSPDILVCDEIGYLPLGTQGSNLFFQVISTRHERKSTIITTNLTFTEWGKIFDSTTVATAIADRLVYNSEILVMEGKSYRKRTR
ncbi:MAG: IS21-like element helper ATPase IstB [Methanosarcinales archaeon]|nr:IS21-like element helper ATPase IstB [Methanosarcinales archaeon]